MKKQIQSFLIILFLVGLFSSTITQGFSQENSFEVSRIVSPVKDLNYNLGDSTDFIIRVRNLGPNATIAGDFLKIDYSIFSADGNNDQTFDTSIMVGSPMPVGKLLEYKLADNLLLGDSNNTFVACAGIEGTALFPINTNKFPSLCTPFLVSTKKINLNINTLYYSEGRLYFNLNTGKNLTAEVFNITGKSLKSINIDQTGQQNFVFNPPTKGFYFMKVFDKSGANTTAKFIVNQ